MEIKITKKEYAKIISNELAFEIHEFYHKIKDIPNEEIIGLELDEIDEGFAEKWRKCIPRLGRTLPESFGAVKTTLGDEFKYIGDSDHCHIFEINGKKF